MEKGRKSALGIGDRILARTEERGSLDAEAVTSQVQLLLSRDLAREVIKANKLAELPEFDPVLRGIWYIDLFLSIVVHGAQLWVALPAGRRAGLHPAYTTFMTFLLGATWWRPLRARGSLR